MAGTIEERRMSLPRNPAQKMFAVEPCERCGSDEDIVRHHIDRNKQNNIRSNIKFLCRSCHAAHHYERGHTGHDPQGRFTSRKNRATTRTHCIRGHDISVYGVRASYRRKGEEEYRYYTTCGLCSGRRNESARKPNHCKHGHDLSIHGRRYGNARWRRCIACARNDHKKFRRKK